MDSLAKVEPGSGKHSVYTHFPKDPNCDICLKTKITRASCRRRAGTAVPRVEKLVNLITADHKILSEGSESRNNHRYAVVVQDLATQWLQSIPCKRKNFPGDPEEPNEVPGASKGTQSHLHWQSFGIWQVLRGIILESLYVNATQIGNKWDCRKSLAQNQGRDSAVLLQSGLDEKTWADSMECYCCLRNIQDLLSDGKSPYERRFGKPCKGPVIPFGAMVDRQVWTKNRGRIPLSATAICERWKISCLMGKHHMKGGSECPSTDR